MSELREDTEVLPSVTQQNIFLKKVRNINFTPFNKGSLALIFMKMKFPKMTTKLHYINIITIKNKIPIDGFTLLFFDKM